ncbi:MAG: hypothetical protein GQ569_07525 [Methylococcaceae bacterium]|nr:hypothetical protein [Methylococcaceae bacterium]
MSVAQPSERLEIIKQICEEKAYHFEYVDNFTQLLAKVSINDKAAFFNFSQYPLNNATSSTLVRDKAFTYTLLEKAGFKIPQGDYFFITHKWRESRNDGKELSDALRYAKQLGYPVFAKPLNGTFGNFANLIHTEEELLFHCQKASEKYFAMIIQQPVFQKEHRIFVMDGKVRFAYCKAQAVIKGDGVKTIAELIKQFISQTPTIHSDYKLNETFIDENLKKHTLNKSSILENNYLFEISPNANPNSGGFVDDLRLNVSPACEQWAADVAKSAGLRVCGIDFFTENNLDDAPEDFTIIELNSNPALGTMIKLGHEPLVKSILADMLEKSLY